MSKSATKKPEKTNYISEGSEWTFDLIQQYDAAIAHVAADYRLDTYPVQLEIITSEQMVDAYSSVGMPLGYNHWSFGKTFVNVREQYRRGAMNLAYEIVINSNPCIAYLMEENTMTMQALVIAHAAYGHNSFFKNNYLFKQWTNADSIIDYLLFAKKFISECEEKYGIDAVEETLDSCHALMNYGVDRYQRPNKLSTEEEKRRSAKREEHLQKLVNELWRTIPEKENETPEHYSEKFPPEPEENVLYFLEKHAPLLEPWQREVIRIVRKIARYFYPQRQTQVMNEGWATFWHYTLLNTLYDRGFVNDAFIIEFLHTHTNVVYQPSFDSPYYSGISPYALGFNMMQDIRRICENPTPEDEQWFPELAHSNWLDSLHYAMANYKDESFIAQYLSPKMIRDFRLFRLIDNDQEDTMEIGSIHDDSGYREIRHCLASQYDLSTQEPNIQVVDVNVRGDRSLTLQHVQQNRRPLNEKGGKEVLKHLYRLWQFPVQIHSVDNDGNITQTLSCPEQ